MSNHRSKCYYCSQEVLSRCIGSHILKKHEAELFKEKDNLSSLHKDKYLKEPLVLTLDVTPYHFCLSDSSCIRKSAVAFEHFKGKKDAHREAVLKLREKYPLDGAVKTDAAPPQPLLDKRETKFLQEEMVELISALRKAEKTAHVDENSCFFFAKKSIGLFRKIGIEVDDEELRAQYPSSFEEPETYEEEQPSVEEQEAPPETPAPEESFEFHDHKVVAQPKIQERPVTALPKTNIALAKPSPPAAPQLKIISNTKSKT